VFADRTFETPVNVLLERVWFELTTILHGRLTPLDETRSGLADFAGTAKSARAP
jgi:hypothetical protein